MRIQSNDIVILDTTDTKKIDLHITSNHPTVQIYDKNSQEPLTPDWEKNPLVLTPIIYIDSEPMTDDLGATFKWTKIKGSEANGELVNDKTKILTINKNDDLNTSPTIRYRCEVFYNNKSFFNEITFARVDNGVSAPTVQAQYSVDGTDGTWETALDSTIHKYIHFSYNGGINWTTPIKIAGEQGEAGQSISLKGTAYTNNELVVGDAIELFSDESKQTRITSGTPGDSYLVDGYLCVYNGSQFICTGQLQGPKGEDGTTYYLYVRYANDTSGSDFSDVPGSRKYVGFYRSTVTPLPTNVDKTSATWNWAKFVGEDAKSITLTGNAQAFKVDKNNKVSPETIKVTAQVANTTIPSSGWTYSVNGGSFTTTTPTGVSRYGSEVTLIGASMTANSISIKASDGTYSDILTIYRVADGSDGRNGTDGADAPIVFLTNENITFTANANGQVAKTTMICNVVAYSGTTSVTPIVGEILPLDIPSGMTINKSTVSNEVRLTIDIAENATLGSTQNTHGVITIPITSPVATNLQLTWSKINSGASIKSTTVSYGVSDNASTRPVDTAWQSNIPIVSEGKYLWTRTIIDYTDDTVPDTVTYTYAKQGSTGAIGPTGSSGTSVTVKSIEYQAGASATTAPTGTWSSNVVSVAEGKYLWTKTVFSDGKTAYGVAKQGSSGRGVSSIIEQYYQSTSATTQSGGSWSATAPTWADGKYIWTRSVITYTDSTTSTTSPICVTGQKGGIGGTGIGVSSVDVWYYQSTSATSLSGGSWSTTAPTWSDGKYIWTKTITTYTNGTTDETTAACITGQKGATGTPASVVSITPSAHYFKSTTGKDGTFTPEYIYIYPRFQTVTFGKWEYSTNGGTTWVAVSGANGLSIGTYNSVANSLRISRTSTLYTDTVTSISFRCVSSNTSVYDTVSIAKIYDVVDLEIGGRNLLKNTNISTLVTKDSSSVPQSTFYLVDGYDFSELIGQQLTLSYLVSNLGDGVDTGSGGTAGRFGMHGSIYWKNSTSGETKVEYPFTKHLSTKGLNKRVYESTIITPPSGYDTITAISIACQPHSKPAPTNNNTWKIGYPKLEIGNKATDWTPAPEDVSTDIVKVDKRITDSLVDFKTTTDSISSKVSKTEESIEIINGNISSLSTQISEAEQKITSDAIVSTVRKSTDYINDLGKKVGTNEIISKINQTAEAVTIEASKIGLLGATNIPNLTADKIKGGTLTLGGSSATTQNGQLLVKNASNTDVLKVNKDGIIVRSGHLAVAEDFTDQYFDWETESWLAVDKTSQLELGDNFIRMGVYNSGNYTNNMYLLNDKLRFQGHGQGIGLWGSSVGHDEYGYFTISDDVRGDIYIKGQDDVTLANINSDGLYVNGPISGGITMGNAKQLSNVFVEHFPGSHNGYIGVRLGTTTRYDNSMITIKGHITSYQNSTSFEASCYYYYDYDNFYGTVATMTNPDVLKEVYFAEEASTGYVYLLLGGVNSTWDYPTISIENISIGYDGHTVSEWNSEWIAGVYSDLSSFTRVAPCARGGMSKILWSGAVAAGSTITLDENVRNFKFLTCVIGSASAPYGIVLGSFLDDSVSELHFLASTIITGSTVGKDFYVAKFNIADKTKLSLTACASSTNSQAYCRKIVGWR